MNCNDLGKFKIKKQKTLVDFFYYCKNALVELTLRSYEYKLRIQNAVANLVHSMGHTNLAASNIYFHSFRYYLPHNGRHTNPAASNIYFHSFKYYLPHNGKHVRTKSRSI